MIETYTDLVVIVLAALAVILTVLAIFIGILSIWGYRAMQTAAEKKASKAAKLIIARSLDNGGELNTMVKEALGRDGDLFKSLQEDIFAGVLQWESSGFEDEEEEEET